MTAPLLKICGLKRQSDVLECMKSGIDILGFVTEYPVDVPWNLTRIQARALLKLVNPPQLSCLVTGGSVNRVIDLAMDLRPDLIQLHYKETLEDTRQITELLLPMGIRVIKTIPISDDEQMQQFGTNDLNTIVNSLNRTGIYAILTDTRGPSNAAAAGTLLNPDFCRSVKNLSVKPVFIAGGINADNISDLAAQTGIYFFDIMTGVEIEPGIKDLSLVARAVEAVKNLQPENGITKRVK